jgi:DNA-binding NtrC family response regulator
METIKTIVISSDDEYATRIYQKLLENYRVIAYQEKYGELHLNEADLLLMDHRANGQDLRFVRDVRKGHPDLPVVGITSMLHAFPPEMNVVTLTKPISIDSLLETVGDMIGGYRK